MRWFWGLLILTLGLALLGRNLGLINADQLNNLWQFWPLIIVLFGLALIVRHIKIGWLILLIAYLAALIFVFYAPIPVTKSSLNEQPFSEIIPQGATAAKVTIDFGGGNLKVSQTDTKLVSGVLLNENHFSNVEVVSEVKDNLAQVTIKAPRKNNFWFRKTDLDLQINSQIPIDLIINTGASNLDLDFTQIQLASLKINAGATNIETKIGKVVGTPNVDISVGASDIKVLLPKEKGAQIIAKTGLSGQDFTGFKQINDNTWQNDRYESDNNKINFKIDGGVSNFSFSTY